MQCWSLSALRVLVGGWGGGGGGGGAVFDCGRTRSGQFRQHPSARLCSGRRALPLVDVAGMPALLALCDACGSATAGSIPRLSEYCQELPNIAADAYQDVCMWSAC